MKWPPERVYFIADIGANHDGELARAVKLIRLCASVGVDAVKFQHFRADKIVSRKGFDGLRVAHQKVWPKSVYETYRDASLPWEWTPRLAEECVRYGMDFLSTPYDLEAVDHLDQYVSMWKIGSGDITWHELIARAVRTGKPVLLSTGASTLDEVAQAMSLLDGSVGLMQCTSDYTGSRDMSHANVRVLETYAARWPNAILGLSDHSPNYTAVLPAVALGARIIEKHFTDDPHRSGPDHGFAMDPHIWHDCIERTRECEAALGDGVKRVEANERETVVVQRRILRAARNLGRGTVLRREDIAVLRPAPDHWMVTVWLTIPPSEIDKVVGTTLTRDLEEGDPICRAFVYPGGDAHAREMAEYWTMHPAMRP